MKNLPLLKIVLIFTFLLIFGISVFAQVDLARQTTAVTYPLDEVVEVKFRGTTRFPRMSGSAKIKRTSKNGTEIDLSVDPNWTFASSSNMSLMKSLGVFPKVSFTTL